MKIGYLPPYRFYSPEYQHFQYFEKVAKLYGVETKMTLTPDEINEYNPDFVFVFGEYHGKLTEHPHYGLVQSPDVNYIKDGEMTEFGLSGVYRWDGYLTMAKATEEWIERMLKLRGDEVPPRVGKFFVAGDLQQYEENYEPTKLVYAGGGWDNRGITLIKALTQMLGDEFELYGSPENWEKHNLPSYKGFANSTDALLDIYRGAVCMSISNPNYYKVDIITTRMHESSSVGANCITPWSPETMMTYGNNLYYYNGDDNEIEQAKMIYHIYQSIKINKADRDARRQKAHEIFNKEHSLTVQFARLLRYHEYMKIHMALHPREFVPDPKYLERIDAG